MRWIVIVLATSFALGMLSIIFPGIFHVAFHVGKFGVTWVLIFSIIVMYLFHRMTNR